jgi:hypothetical protein
VRAGRTTDAEALVRHLPVEAAEIHELYTEWSRRIPALVGLPARDATPHDQRWRGFTAACAAWRAADPIEPVLAIWADAHDRHLEEVAELVDLAVAAWGEERLGELWSELQRDGRAFYRATYGPDRPWSASAERLVQVAIEGMHGHLGGPRRRGEITVDDDGRRVVLAFEPCGSGGSLLARGIGGTVTGSHGFAWSTPGVCRYCVHCCVLQQLGAIDDLGHPARVIDPPTRPGQRCTWTVYADPAAVPAEAYRRVGRRPPAVAETDGEPPGTTPQEGRA